MVLDHLKKVISLKQFKNRNISLRLFDPTVFLLEFLIKCTLITWTQTRLHLILMTLHLSNLQKIRPS